MLASWRVTISVPGETHVCEDVLGNTSRPFYFWPQNLPQVSRTVTHCILHRVRVGEGREEEKGGICCKEISRAHR